MTSFNFTQFFSSLDYLASFLFAHVAASTLFLQGTCLVLNKDDSSISSFAFTRRGPMGISLLSVSRWDQHYTRNRPPFDSCVKSSKRPVYGIDDRTRMEDRLVSDTPLSERGIGVGIDLGTTNSAVAVLTREDGFSTPVIVPCDRSRGRTLPSVVCLADRKNVIVGQEAVKTEHMHHSSTYRNVKRIIGTGGRTALENAQLVPNFVMPSFGDVLSESSSLEPQNKAPSKERASTNRNGKKKASSKIDSKGPCSLAQQLEDAKKSPAMISLVEEGEKGVTHISPEEVSSHILRKLFDAAERHTGETVTRAVVGVPAYFHDAQRNATERACRLAGVSKVRLLREPEAAALAYGLGKEQLSNAAHGGGIKKTSSDDDELVLVFDLGGGTFDVSVLLVGGGVMEVVATSGNSNLGGSDFDRKIARYMQMKIEAISCVRSVGMEKAQRIRRIFQNSAVVDAVMRSAEAVRVSLSNAKLVTMTLPVTADGWLGISNAADSIIPAEVDNITLQGGEEKWEEVESGYFNGTHVTFSLSRKEMEELCKKELQALLRPVREVAILAGALLPGDARPSLVEAAMGVKEEAISGAFDEFYDSKEKQSNEKDMMIDGGEMDSNVLLQIKSMDLKALRKEQQRGRRKARDLRTRERRFREEKRKAETKAKSKGGGSRRASSSVGGKVKVRDSISGRPLSQVVLVGGATRMPAIGRTLAALTGVVPRKTVNPDEAVALGAAVQVGILDGDEALGDLQVLTPIQAAVLRAMARKRGLDKER